MDELLIPLVDETIKCVRITLEDVDMDVDDIHQIVLVGGGTLTPIIRKEFSAFFGKEMNTGINPMEAGE